MKLCYILPEYSDETDSHFYHLYELLKELSSKLNIFLLVEKLKKKKGRIRKKGLCSKISFSSLTVLGEFFNNPKSPDFGL